MKVERRILSLPNRPNPGSEYDIGSWNFDLEKANPEIITAAQYLTQLLIDPEDWTLEAYTMIRDPWSRVGRFRIGYAFYSQSRERAKFSRRQLDLNLKAIIKPEVFENYYNGGTTDLKGINHHWVNLKPIGESPFTTPFDSQTTVTYPYYLVEGVTLRNFALYLKYNLLESGGGFFDQTVFDPRRLVAELQIEEPLSALRSLLLDPSKSQTEIDRYIKENRHKYTSEILSRIETRFAAIEEQRKGLIVDLS